MINNGVELQVMTYNDAEVNTWIHNDVDAYSGFKPFYVIENGLLVEGNYTSAERLISYLIQNQDTNYGVYGVADWSGNAHHGGALVKFKRGKANKLRFKGEAYAGGGKLWQLLVYGDGIQIHLSNSAVEVSTEKVIDLGEYNEISVDFRCIANADLSGSGVGATITELYCYQQE